MKPLPSTPVPAGRDRGALVLGIESSCDETAAAVVRDGREVLSSVVRTQVAEHAPWRGVVPEIACRGHLDAIAPVIEEALSGPGARPADLAAVAVTVRPGLIGSLLVGATAAKSLAWAWNRPLVAVHHIEAHAYAALMSQPEWRFPYVTLVASGGHTSLHRTSSPLCHEPLGATRDDAAGEALDKAAALLGLPYPGGPAIEAAGALGNPRACPFKLPLLDPDSLDFSFSGLKTALLYRLKGPGVSRRDAPLPSGQDLADLCASYEAAVMETLAQKCLRACARERVPRLLVGGGVARNRRLRAIVEAASAGAGVEAVFAAPPYCTDNAAMVAGLGHALWLAGATADLGLDVAAR